LATGFAFKKFKDLLHCSKTNSSNPKFYSENTVLGKRGDGFRPNKLALDAISRAPRCAAGV
jgi:hypothetical protein